MLSITKRFPAIPISHRQTRHEGHCQFLHGHDWRFEVEIVASAVDPKTGFIFDFGDFKEYRHEVFDELDHATLVTPDDAGLEELAHVGFIKPFYIKDASCEGLTRFLFDDLNNYISNKTTGRAWVRRVTVWEGDMNSATVTS